MKGLPFKMRTDSEIEKWRAATFWDKEPETIAWISDFQKDQIFWDIGANIGCYSLLAASMGLEVLAFEPVEANYEALKQNAHDNKFENLLPWNAGISDVLSISEMTIPDGRIGASGAQIIPAFDHGVGSQLIQIYPIDFLVWSMCIGDPDHIKIDVDGIESKIISGAARTIKEGTVKSWLIEVNTCEDAAFISDMLSPRYTLDNKYNSMANHSSIRRGAAGPHNQIWTLKT